MCMEYEHAYLHMQKPEKEGECSIYLTLLRISHRSSTRQVRNEAQRQLLSLPLPHSAVVTEVLSLASMFYLDLEDLNPSPHAQTPSTLT